jgi:hypothetical protein
MHLYRQIFNCRDGPETASRTVRHQTQVRLSTVLMLHTDPWVIWLNIESVLFAGFVHQPADCTAGWVIDAGDAACFDLVNCGLAKLRAANRVAVAITPRVFSFIKELSF